MNRPTQLTEGERRALDSLERAVAAEDPRLDARLRGGVERPRSSSPAVLLGTALLVTGLGCLVAGAYLGPAGPLVAAAVTLETIGAGIAAFGPRGQEVSRRHRPV